MPFVMPMPQMMVPVPQMMPMSVPYPFGMMQHQPSYAANLLTLMWASSTSTVNTSSSVCIGFVSSSKVSSCALHTSLVTRTPVTYSQSVYLVRCSASIVKSCYKVTTHISVTYLTWNAHSCTRTILHHHITSHTTFVCVTITISHHSSCCVTRKLCAVSIKSIRPTLDFQCMMCCAHLRTT